MQINISSFLDVKCIKYSGWNRDLHSIRTHIFPHFWLCIECTFFVPSKISIHINKKGVCSTTTRISRKICNVFCCKLTGGRNALLPAGCIFTCLWNEQRHLCIKSFTCPPRKTTCYSTLAALFLPSSKKYALSLSIAICIQGLNSHSNHVCLVELWKAAKKIEQKATKKIACR